MVGHDGAVLCRGLDHREREAGVVGLCVPVDEPALHPIGVEGGQMPERLAGADAPMEPADAPSSREVVEPENPIDRLRQPRVDEAVPAEERNEKRQEAHKMWRVAAQALPFVQCLVDQAVVPLVEIPKPAVDELRGLRGRSRGPVVALDQGNLQPSGGGVQRDARPGDAATDDQHVEALRCQATQIEVPVECGLRRHAGILRGVVPAGRLVKYQQ